MITFSDKEKKFLNSMEECRIATTHDNTPHVKPVSYIFDDDQFLVATDYDTRMYKNVKANSNVALSIDVYKHSGHKAVLIQGNVKIIEQGEEFSKIFKKFHDKFEWVRDEPWSENEAPFLEITPFSKASWGLK